MRQRWFTLTQEGHHWVAAALFREGQLEMGLENLEQMNKHGFQTRPWLSDLAIYTLSENGEFDYAMQIIKDRMANGDLLISKSVWWHLLDHASSAFHYIVTCYCWKSQVNPGYLNPSSGTCLNVLTTAAQAGDVNLATEVFSVLGKRGTVFQAIHYELLLTTYLNADSPDLRAAFTVLTIMTSVKLEITTATTRPLLQHLLDHPKKAIEAFEILTSLNEANRPVPIAALNVVIEANAYNENLAQALIVYKAMHTFERQTRPQPHKPLANVETFNLLLRCAHHVSPPAYQTAIFLVSEMLALDIKPDTATYHRLILVCLKVGNHEHAWRYFDEMDSLGFKPEPQTAHRLARQLALIGDGRCWDVLQRLQDHGALSSYSKRGIEKAWVEWEKSSSPTPTDERALGNA